MKKIIVPTDFSDNAFSALEYAVQLANQFESTIYLISSYVVRRRTGMLKSIEDIQKKDSDDSLKKLMKKIKNQLSENVTITTASLKGDVVHSIVRFASSVDADLIVMGTRGNRNMPRLFWGSNTIGVMNNSDDIPLLAIPENYSFQAIKRIVFATDMNNISNAKVIEPMLALTKSNKAEIEILHVAPIESKNDELANDFYFSDVDHTYYQVDDNQSSLNESIDRFVDATKSQLLCMIKKKRGLLNDLFHKSVTEREAARLDTPLLVMYDKE